MTSSTSSPRDSIVPWRMRRDLVANSCATNGESGWTLKDPLSLAYFRLRDIEYAVLLSLDGRSTYGALLTALQERFPSERLSMDNLKVFVSSLVQSGLVIGSIPGLSRLFARQQQATRKRQRWSWLTGILAIRWKGIDPEPLMKRIEPWTHWLFRPLAIAGFSVLIAFSLVLVTLRWDVLLRRLPDSHALFGMSNLLPLVLVFVVIKVLHELGHVLTCRHFGGECHELGIQVLLFMPLFYGDVTDAWMLSRRWPRIAISMAGIFVELVLAAVATLLWWNSVPGLLNSIFLNVMLVCSVNTLLFNGNPLLRYDGYYATADLLNLPNLASQARQTVMSLCEWLLVGISDEEPETDSSRWWLLVGYGITSGIYRWFVLLGIVWFLHQLLGGSGLSIVATILSAMIVSGAILSPLREFVQRVRSRWNSGTLPTRRAGKGLAVLVVSLASLLLIPFPYSVSAPFVIYPADAQPVFISVSGRIETAVQPGASVKVGDPLGELRNHELDLQHERQVSEVNRLTLRLKSIEAQRGNSETIAMRLPATRDALESARRRLNQLSLDLQRLHIISPTTGTVLPPPNVTRSRPSDETLADWQGTPLEPANQGATLREQTLFCYIGEPSRHDAVLLVDQDAVEFVRAGQTVRLQLTSAPGQVRTGQVEEIATSRSESVPRELLVTHLAAVRNTTTGIAPAEVAYEVRVRLHESVAPTTSLYSPGRARIQCGTLSLATRLWRLLRHTFTADIS